MRALPIILATGAVVGGYIIFKNIGKAHASEVPAINTGVAATMPNLQSIYGNTTVPATSYPQYSVPQTPAPAPSQPTIAITSSGVQYADPKLSVMLGTDILGKIPLISQLFA